MKIVPFLIGLVLTFASLAGTVDAYGIYGASSFPAPYGYRESTDFYGNFNANRNVNTFTGSTDVLFQNRGTQSLDFNELYQNSGNSGFSNAYFQNFLQNAHIDLNSGYDFTKGPCVTEKIKGNFRGKDNDFTIRREVCDNIQGTFFKNNNYAQSFSNSASQNALAFDTRAYQNQYGNRYMLDNDFTNKQASKTSQTSNQQSLSVNFGKGTRIVLN